MSLRTALAPLAAALLVACVPDGRPVVGAAPAEPRVAAEVHDRALSAARVALDSAARDGDVALVARFLAADGELTTPDGRVLRGPAEAERWLRAHAGGRNVVELQLQPERVQQCTDGVVEREGHLFVAYSEASRPDTLRARYSSRWVLQRDGSLRASHLAIAAPGARAPRAERCASLVLARARSQRVSAWILPPGVSGVRVNSVADATDRLGAQGYGDGRLFVGAGMLRDHEGSVLPSSATIGAVGARVRVWRGLGVEANTTLQPVDERLQMYDRARSSYLTLDHEARVLAGLVSYEWWRLRVGAGPYVTLADWRLQEDRVRDLGQWRYFVDGVQCEERWRSSDVGVALDAQFTQPVLPGLSFKFVAQYRGLGESTIRATGRSTEVRVSNGGTTFGIAIGTGF